MQHYSGASDQYQYQYQASDQYPMYTDYSSHTVPTVHRRNGLEFDSIIPAHSFINNYNHRNQLNHLNYRKQVDGIRLKQKTARKRKARLEAKKKEATANKTKKTKSNPSTKYRPVHLERYVKYDNGDSNITFDQRPTKYGSHDQQVDKNITTIIDTTYSDK